MIRRRVSTPAPENNDDFHLLEGLDSALESLLNLGKTRKATECMNQALKIRSDLYGDSSKEVLSYVSYILTKTCSSCSSLIERGKVQDCIELLRNLLVLSSNYPLGPIAEETCEVYNTLAVALRKSGKSKIAKKYAMKALALANSFKSPEKLLSSIYLNLCAIYSSLSQHREAAAHCQQAIQLAQEDLLNLKLTKPQDDFIQEVSVLAVAYHNLGVEEEYLKNYEIALSWYRKAVKFLEKHANSSHFSMLEEFRKSYEDAQRVCKQKYNQVHLNRTLKEDYFFDESSFSEYDSKLGSVKSKSQAGGFKMSAVHRIPSLAIGRGVVRSDSGSSFNKSKRHKKLIELDSDIRELENLGLLEHDRTSSRRSRSSARSGELSPIKKGENKKGFVSSSQNFDYSENVFKIRKAEESARHRKVIREDPSIKQAIVLKAVLKLQNFFRIRRLRKWYKEIQSGKLFGVMLKCEKVINEQKYLVSFSIEKGESSLCVLIKASPLNSVSIPEPAKYSLFEVCSIINAWNTKLFEMRKSELLIHIFIENNKVILRKSPEISMDLVYQGCKKLNNMFSYQISIYLIQNPSIEPSMLIDGRSLKKSPPIVRVLIVSVKELSSILSVKQQDLQRNLDKVINLVIFEGEGELTLSKRSLCPEIPIINIFTTNTDDFTDQYKQYESSSKRVDRYEDKVVVFCVGNSDKGKAALVIQKNLKAAKQRKEFVKIKKEWQDLGLKCTLDQFYKAVVMMQKFARGWKVRKGRRKGDKELKIKPEPEPATPTPDDNSLSQAAVLIQSRYRSHKAQKQYQAEKSRALTAACVIQTAVKSWLGRKSAANPSNPSNSSNPPIPSLPPLPPSVPSQKSSSRSRPIRLQAIICIQKFFKGWRARREFKELKTSAIVIQKNFKAFSTRKAFKAKLLETRSIKTVQRFIRKWLKRRRNLHKAESDHLQEKMNEASIVIQKNFKAHKARKDFLEKREQERLQQQQAMQNLQVLQEKSENSLKNILKVFIFQLKLKEIQLDRDLIISSAIKIQSRYKSWVCRKRYLSTLNYMVNVKAGTSFNQLLKAALIVQKFIRGWRIRRIYNLKKFPADRYLNAVITIQKYVKGWKARRQMEDLKSGNLVIDRFAALLDNSPYIVSVSQTTSQYVIRAVNSVSMTAIYGAFEVEEQPLDKVLENIYMRNGAIYLSVTKTRKPFKHVLYEGTKTFAKQDFDLKVFIEPDGYTISLASGDKTLTSKLKFPDLVERYSDKINVADLVKDLKLVGNKVVLEANVILVKKSKLIMEKLYTITMYEKGKFLVFEIMHGSSWKKKIFISYEEAVRLTGIVNGKVTLGHYIIEHCMLIRGKKISVVYRKKKTNNLSAIIKIQAHIRSYITRKRLKKRNLILVTEKQFHGKTFKIYCHFYLGKFSIVAQTGELNLSLVIDKPMAPELTQDYLRKSILPFLSVTESVPFKLFLKPVQSQSVDSSSLGPQGKAGPTFVSLTPNLNLSHKKSQESRSSIEKSSKIYRRSKKPSNVDDSSNPLTSEPLSPQMTPSIKLRKTRQDFEETMKSLNMERIVLKTGVIISGIYLIITMKLQEDGVFVQACNETGLIDLDLYIKTKRVKKINEKQIEDLCSELLTQLKIVSGLDGKMRLALIDNSEETKDEVIYRRSHYISNRYLTITIFENFRGVFLIASEGEKNVFNMKLGRRRVGNSQKTQEELTELVKKLKVQVVLGQEMLVLSS